MAKAIQINNLKKVFSAKGKSANITAIENISLEVNTGEFVAVVGPSGCGKSTLLKLIGGILKPSNGNILIKGRSVEYSRLQKEFGFIFQKPSLLPWRTVLENICLPLEIINKNSLKSERSACAKSMLKIVGLLDFKNNLPSELSGGMQQRASIARALIFEPPFLLMDEPFSALDEISRNYMDMELLRIWCRLKPTIIYVTHSIEEAVFLADKVVVLSKRPAKIKKILNINLHRPRTAKIRYTQEFNKIVKSVLDVLK